MPICNWSHSARTSLRCLVSLLLCRGVPQLRPQGVDPRALPLSRVVCRKLAPLSESDGSAMPCERAEVVCAQMRRCLELLELFALLNVSIMPLRLLMRS